MPIYDITINATLDAVADTEDAIIECIRAALVEQDGIEEIDIDGIYVEAIMPSD